MRHAQPLRLIATASIAMGITAAAGVVACDVAPDRTTSTPEAMRSDVPVATVIVCGLDRSASYRMVADGAAVCRAAADSLKPGDVFIVHYISDQTYLNSEEVVRLDLRDLVSKSCEGNPFDHRCTARARAVRSTMRGRVDSLKHLLLSLAPKPAPRTDIVGIAAVAADAARALPRHQLRLIIASDMIDNVGYQFKPELRGAHVEIVRFQTSADPAKSDQLRLRIEQQFRDWGAASVRVTTARQQ